MYLEPSYLVPSQLVPKKKLMTKLIYRLLPFSKRLFLSVILLFVIFATCFLVFQYQREKAYKSDLLNMQLQNYNNRMYDFITSCKSLDTDSLQQYVVTHIIPDIRVTIITTQGKVIYDNIQSDVSKFETHRTRKEVQDALMYGSGYDINRISASSSANMDMEELSSGRASARSCFACSSPFSHSSTRLAPFLKFFP